MNEVQHKPISGSPEIIFVDGLERHFLKVKWIMAARMLREISIPTYFIIFLVGISSIPSLAESTTPYPVTKEWRYYTSSMKAFLQKTKPCLLAFGRHLSQTEYDRGDDLALERDILCFADLVKDKHTLKEKSGCFLTSYNPDSDKYAEKVVFSKTNKYEGQLQPNQNVERLYHAIIAGKKCLSGGIETLFSITYSDLVGEPTRQTLKEQFNMDLGEVLLDVRSGYILLHGDQNTPTKWLEKKKKKVSEDLHRGEVVEIQSKIRQQASSASMSR